MHTPPATLTRAAFGRGTPAWVLLGGIGAGTLDIVYACVFWAIHADVPARRIFQSVAAGLLGPASFQGGWPTALLGLLLHYLIALAMALTFFLAARRMPVLVARPVPCGAVYGLLLYAVMNHLVVPLSRASPGARDPAWVGLSIAAHMFLIGVPIAMCTRQAVTRYPS